MPTKNSSMEMIESMAAATEPHNVMRWTEAQIDELTKGDLLEAVHTLESVYKPTGRRQDPSHDHRRYLSRPQLRNVFQLAKGLAAARLES